MFSKPTLYLETTIPSYLLADASRDIVAVARQDITRRWWHRDKNRFDMVVSEVVLKEAAKGDQGAAQKRLAFLEQFHILEATSDIPKITGLYLKGKIVPFGSVEDAAHLAFASIHEIAFVCTWNFKHLANAFALKRLRTLNEQLGLYTPSVCTPEELLGE
ncbi:MAG TPA: type II toxin-antitoxin system VapC family toxin [Candidatus Hydrogenedentes bacterium]|nr:type II toxin-antitoxin system VapC family toxin [Candidatus Hydrogenedentota bacterium]